ncbi:hypothetical protein NA56DRAFT_706772 [Hyaloscypha hepaticicola]|uniref:Uncharacterized protein n=1 Tax=Hyaloscypha hepaticicola TaxID=2082293 RepID=A0A2J6PVV0_9HELO|nr:hypothetical protein NA56DRAFT_706772 [Hyaloscypha hepaticicola]
MKITPIPRSDNASCKQKKQANYWVKCLAERGNGGVLPMGAFGIELVERVSEVTIIRTTRLVVAILVRNGKEEEIDEVMTQLSNRPSEEAISSPHSSATPGIPAMLLKYRPAGRPQCPAYTTFMASVDANYQPDVDLHFYLILLERKHTRHMQNKQKSKLTLVLAFCRSPDEYYVLRSSLAADVRIGAAPGPIFISSSLGHATRG